jgi:YD repeat-containing protein
MSGPIRICAYTARACVLTGAALLINIGVIPWSSAQIAALPQPEFTLKDENDVDLLSFNAYLQQTDVSIGSKDHPLTHTIFSGPDGNWDEMPAWESSYGPPPMDSFYPGIVQWPGGGITMATCTPMEVAAGVYVQVAVGASSESFRAESGAEGPCSAFAAVDPTGDTLTYNYTASTYTYVKRDGTQIVLNAGQYGLAPSSDPLQKIVYPDGRVLTYWYDGNGRLQSITRSDGLQLKYTYAQNSSLIAVTAINNAYDYCTPTAATCSLSMSWPTTNYSWTASGLTVTDALGRVTGYTMDGSGRTVGIELPSSTGTVNISYQYCDSNCPQYAFEGQAGVQYQNYVLRVTRDLGATPNGDIWNYGGTPGSPTSTQCGTATYGFTNPVQSGKQVSLYNCLPPPFGPSGIGPSDPFIEMTDEQGVQFKGPGALIQDVLMPEGNQTQYAWDGRGNLTQETRVPNTGSSGITSYANYDSTCANPLKCNEPNWVKDGKGFETDYTYNPSNGEVATKTLPPDANGVRPETHYTYVQRYAWVLNVSRTYVRSAAPIWVLSTEWYCRTSAASSSGCGGGASDEVSKTYQYGPDSGPNNLFVRGVAVTADGTTRLTCYGYDRFGHRTSVTTPNAALASCP